MILRKKETTKQLLEKFYGKDFSEITADDLGGSYEVDFGEDVGNEVF